MIPKKSFAVANVAATADAVLDHARDMLAVAAGPRGWDDGRKSWLARGARVLGITPSRAETIWYRKSRGLSAHEYLQMVERARGVEERLAQRRGERDAILEAVAGARSASTVAVARRAERAAVDRGEARPPGSDGQAAAGPVGRVK